MTAAAHRSFLVIPGIVLLVAVLGIRVVWSGREDLRTARQCEAIGLNGTAIDFYARAARWYVPFATTSQDAIEGLLNISRGSMARKDAKTALKALREARGAILGTRWLFTPGARYLPDINEGIASLMATRNREDGKTSDADEILAQLERTNLPNPWLSLAATLLFVAWIPVTVVGASRVVTAQGRFAGRAGLPWIAVSAGLLGGWLLLVAIV